MPLSLADMRRRAERHERRRQWSREYPAHPMVDFDFKLKRSVRSALAAFKTRGPFRDTCPGFVASTRILFTDLARAYDVRPVSVRHAGDWTGSSGASTYNPNSHSIVLRGKRSVLTALHEFAHARGYGETAAVWWSVNTFRLTFPQAFARLQPATTPGHLLVRGFARSIATARTAWQAYYEDGQARIAEAEAIAAEAAAQAAALRATRASRQAAHQRRINEVRARQTAARASALADEQALRRQGSANTEVLRFPPENASDSEVSSWDRMGPGARQAIYMRRQAEAVGNRATPNPVTAGRTDIDPVTGRQSFGYRRLDTSDVTSRPLPEPETDAQIERFRRLDIA